MTKLQAVHAAPVVPDDITLAWADAAAGFARVLSEKTGGEKMLLAARDYVRADRAFLAALEPMLDEMIAEDEQGKPPLRLL